jgi:hypothetical protein
MYIQLTGLTFIIMMIIMMVGPFIRPVRLMLISIFEEFGMMKIYCDLLAGIEQWGMPDEYLDIFMALIMIGLAIINVALLMAVVSLLWPIVWLVAIIAALAFPMWLIKRKKVVS